MENGLTNYLSAKTKEERNGKEDKHWQMIIEDFAAAAVKTYYDCVVNVDLVRVQKLNIESANYDFGPGQGELSKWCHVYPSNET